MAFLCSFHWTIRKTATQCKVIIKPVISISSRFKKNIDEDQKQDTSIQYLPELLSFDHAMWHQEPIQ